VRRTALLICAVAVSVAGCVESEFSKVPEFKGVYSEPPTIRVLLVKSAGPERLIDLQTRGGYGIYIPGRKGFILEGSDLPAGHIKVDDGKGVQIGNKHVGKGRVTVLSRDEGLIGINDRFYRGSVVIEPEKGGRFSVVNTVDLESYLRGVIPCEMPNDWPPECLLAQAIASRSFALWRVKSRSDKPYDVTADIYSQVYQGVDKESPVTNAAVDTTRGIVMLYNKKLFPAYFHSNSGGHTANAFTVWREYQIPPLAGVPDPYVEQTPGYFWREHFTRADIIKAIKTINKKVDLTKLRSIMPIDRSASGHASRVRLNYGTGYYEITADALRKCLGRDKHGFLALRSTKFNVIPKGDSFMFFGYGNGHGVGMSQWGAYEMAKRGRQAVEIVAHY